MNRYPAEGFVCSNLKDKAFNFSDKCLYIFQRSANQFQCLATLGNKLQKHCGAKCFPVKPRGKHVAETNFVAREQEMFLSQVKNIFAFRTQILLTNLVFKYSLQKNINCGFSSEASSLKRDQ